MLLLWFGESREPHKKYELDMTSRERIKVLLEKKQTTIWQKHWGKQLQVSNHELLIYLEHSVRDKEEWEMTQEI